MTIRRPGPLWIAAAVITALAVVTISWPRVDHSKRNEAERLCKERTTQLLAVPEVAIFGSLSTKKVDGNTWRSTGVVDTKTFAGESTRMRFSCMSTERDGLMWIERASVTP